MTLRGIKFGYTYQHEGSEVYMLDGADGTDYVLSTLNECRVFSKPFEAAQAFCQQAGLSIEDEPELAFGYNRKTLVPKR